MKLAPTAFVKHRATLTELPTPRLRLETPECVAVFLYTISLVGFMFPLNGR